MENKIQYDVVVIGGGPGGYVAAIRAAQRGAKTALIEKDAIGGVCLNIGCIPTKCLSKSAWFFRDLEEAALLGVDIEKAVLNMQSVVKRKDSVVAKLTGGVRSLLKKNGVRVVKGTASISGTNLVTVQETGETLEVDSIIIATGSVSALPPIEGIDCEGVVTSTELLNVQEVPRRLAIIGGGVIGVEFASIFGAFGTKVTIIEMLPRILPMMDEELSTAMEKELMKRGTEVQTGRRVTSIRKNSGSLTVITDAGEVEADLVLVSVGRKAVVPPSTVELKRLKNGCIEVDDHLRTVVPNIYAIGDVNGIYQLAHVASKEGEVAADNACGHDERMDYKVVPSVVYGIPELAGVGLTEREAREKGKCKVFKFAYAANGKALCQNESTGFVKVVASEPYNEILGVHMIGADAASLIAEACLAISLECTADELSKTIHAHPSLPEMLMEACEGIAFKAIHM